MRSAGYFLTRFALPIIVLISFWASSNLRWSEQGRKYTIISDGKGYYGYLPAIFIYHDLNFRFFDSIEAKYYDEHVKYDYRQNIDGNMIDKYFAGVAVMQMPFFLAGHVTTLMSDQPSDGYSKWYVIWTCIGGIFWLTFGLFYLRKFLKLHGASDGQAAFILFVIYFGTNLFYYAIVEPAMSHVYSFALVSAFLYYGKKWIDTGNASSAFKCAVALGMIALVRPVNVLIVLWLMFEAGGIFRLWERMRELFSCVKYVLLSVAAVFIPMVIQLLIWKMQTGSWFVNSYGDEAFHFTQPHVLDFLFSYKKGMFVYVPLTFIALLGVVPMWKKDSGKALLAILFFVIVFYVLSSWWMWYYGGSFGTRVIVEYLPVFALMLWWLLNGIKLRAVRISLISLIIALTLFCQFQTIQYRYHLIHWSEMTKEKYWDVFLKVP